MMANIHSPCDLNPLGASHTSAQAVAAVTPSAEPTIPPAQDAFLAEPSGDDGPTLDVLLTVEREPSDVSADTPFKAAGRDFHRPHIEMATLRVLLDRPSIVTKACCELEAGDFFLPDAHTLFEAILHVHNSSRAATPPSVLEHFAGTDADRLPEWTEFVNACMAATANSKHLKRYIKLLKEAAAIRGGKGYCPHGYSEFFSVNLLRNRLPPTRCVNRTVYQYRDGFWSEADANLLQVEALNVIHPSQREARRAVEVLKHLESMTQVSRGIFVGAHRRTPEGRILINAQNCVIEVSATGCRSLDHDPSYDFSRKLVAAYDPEASCEIFDRTLREVLPDAADREVLQSFAGYTLEPGCDLELALVCYGPGGTGKSTLAGAIGDVLGRELCSSAGLEELCKSGSYILPTLRQKMLNLGSELTGTEIEESANFKKLVSGEFLSVRAIYGAPEEMQTGCKLLFLTNHPPRFRGGTDAEVRRLRILHFAVKPKVKDTDLKTKLRAETSGILNWMIAGLVRVLRDRAIPVGGATAQAAIASFSRSNDPVGSFVAECCDFAPHLVTIKSELFETFGVWCENVGLCAEKWENFFYKTLLQNHPELTSSRRNIEGKRQHCLVGIGRNAQAPRPGDDDESALRRKALFARLRAPAES